MRKGIIQTVLILALGGCGVRPEARVAADSAGRPSTPATAVPTALPPSEVTATDSTIRIVARNGDTLQFVDSVGDGEYAVSYAYRGRLGTLPFYLIEVHYYETSGFLLIHDSTGRVIHIRNDPVISPDGREIVVAHHAWTSESGRSKLEVWTVSGDSLTTEFRWEQPIEYAWGPKEARWRNQDTIDVIKEVPTGYRQDMREVPAYLARVNGVWVTHGLFAPEDTITTHSRPTP